MAGLAVDVGYADQAHLSPERFHLSRLTLRQLIGSSFGRCLRTHEHAASYQPFSPPAPGGRSVPDLLDSFKTGATPAPSGPSLKFLRLSGVVCETAGHGESGEAADGFRA
jgi:hypothetical protein